MKENKESDLSADVIAPLYKKLSEQIREQIRTGYYKPGDKLPSESELCKKYGVSRITVRNALKNLAEEKLLVKYHGKGTFVAYPEKIEVMESGNSFTKSCQRMNAVPSTKVISMTVKEAGIWIAKKLGIEETDKMLCIKRLRMVDGIPTIWEIDYFRMNFLFLLEEDLETVSLLETIHKKTGIVCEVSEDIFDVAEAEKEIAMYLDCLLSTTLLRVCQTVYGGEGNVVYFNEQYILTDQYKYAVRSKI